MFMVYRNAKDEAQGVWGNQEASWNSFNFHSFERNRRTSPGIGNQSLGIDRADWEGSNTTSESECSPGGILDQLIDETRQEITECETKLNKLGDRLQKLLSFREQLDE